MLAYCIWKHTKLHFESWSIWYLARITCTGNSAPSLALAELTRKTQFPTQLIGQTDQNIALLPHKPDLSLEQEKRCGGVPLSGCFGIPLYIGRTGSLVNPSEDWRTSS